VLCRGIGRHCRLEDTPRVIAQPTIQLPKSFLRATSNKMWHAKCKGLGFGFGTCLQDFSQNKSEWKIMLSRCANAQCSKPFLRLREGKLFLVETERVARPGEATGPPFVRARQSQRQVEHFWLCDECATQYSLVYDRERGVALVSLRRPVAAVRAESPLSGKIVDRS
jgi:hypothetical protein